MLSGIGDPSSSVVEPDARLDKSQQLHSSIDGIGTIRKSRGGVVLKLALTSGGKFTLKFITSPTEPEGA